MDYDPTLILLARWVQSQTYQHRVLGDPITPLQEETELLLRKRGVIGEDGKWKLDRAYAWPYKLDEAHAMCPGIFCSITLPC